jgi:hypothetical protein
MGPAKLAMSDSRATMCNLYSITTNQAAIIALFRVVNRYVGNLPPMPGVFGPGGPTISPRGIRPPLLV